MNVDRAERSPLPDPQQRDDDARRAERPRTDSQRGAERLEEHIAAASEPWPSAANSQRSPPTCRYRTKEQVDACAMQTIPGAQLFIEGEGDVDLADANDIGQRAVGDCHLLGPTMALLQSPEGRTRVREMIKEVQRDGKTVYRVAFRVPVARGDGASYLRRVTRRAAGRETDPSARMWVRAPFLHAQRSWRP